VAALDPVRDGLSIAWDKQPPDGFESHSIADLCSRYDLVVLDYPHIGEAVEADCFVPLEDTSGTSIRFSNAPRMAEGGRPSSTLGGTGIGVSKRGAVTPELKNHL
jgi:hypothetical protein